MVERSAREAGWHKLSSLDILRLQLPGFVQRFVRPLFPRSRALPSSEDRELVAHFSPEALRRLRDTLTRDSGGDRLSTNSAIVGHIVASAARLLGLDPESRVTVSAIVDYRQRVDGLPAAFSGNAVVATAIRPLAAGTPPAEIAGCLYRGLEPMNRSYLAPEHPSWVGDAGARAVRLMGAKVFGAPGLSALIRACRTRSSRPG